MDPTINEKTQLTFDYKYEKHNNYQFYTSFYEH